jgi:hypothetical protein
MLFAPIKLKRITVISHRNYGSIYNHLPTKDTWKEESFANKNVLL